MKKKCLALILSAAMLTVSLAGCGSTNDNSGSDGNASSGAAPTEEASEASDSSSEGTSSVDLSSIKIGGLLSNQKDDGGWNQSQYQCMLETLNELGMSEDQFLYIENCAEETVATTSAVEELIGEGCNMIFGLSTGYAPILSGLVDQYPDVMFVQCGVPLDNMTTYHIRGYEGHYAIGALMATLAGKDTNTFGYVSGLSEAGVRFSINAFALGAKSVNPDARVKLLWANSWYDPTAEGECAHTLAASGIKYIGCSCSSPGTAQACAADGAFTTGDHLDAKAYAPSAVVVSFVWNWVPLMKEIITRYASEGVFVEHYFWGADHGCTTLSYNDDLVTADQKAFAEGILKDLADGKDHVFDGPLSDNTGKELVADGETMDDATILDQEFLVENVDGTWN